MKNIILSVALLFVVGCAHSPQQITINPTVTMEGDSYGKSRPINVSVVDERDVKELGSRGGVYKETSVITISNDLIDAVTKSSSAKLASQGFSVNSTDEQAANVTVLIKNLSYDIPDSTVGKKVKLKAVLGVKATSGNETYTAEYKTSSERQFVMTPNMEENQVMINELLSETLLRLFSDKKLQAFLSNI